MAGKARTRGGARQTLARRAGERAPGRGRSARQAGAGRARRTAWARGARGLGVPVRAGWACRLVSWAKLVHSAPGSVLTQFLDPVRLGIFPKSPNEHCSCGIKFFRKKKIIFIKFK